MKKYSISKASELLQKNKVHSVIIDLYGYDAKHYGAVKKNEGQYAYFQYISCIRRAVRDVFYRPFGHQDKIIADMFKTSSHNSGRSQDTCLILNNTSLLGHVTVLRSLSGELLNSLKKGRLFIACLFKGSNNSEKQWLSAMRESRFNPIQLDQNDILCRFLKIENALKPRQYLWWGWPPGQWIGPLLSPNAIHRSVSFKYDFPASLGFASHHIGYGPQYANYISDESTILGFLQKFSVDLIPSLSELKIQQFLSSMKNSLRQYPLRLRPIINIGTLARSEKVSQKEFLIVIKTILDADSRFIFHWTGKEVRKDVVEFFETEGLAQRAIFHGWVTPFDYLSTLDIYLDTFPFGTGETLVSAGYMGLPVAIMSSPYEANFSNLLEMNSDAATLISYTDKEYVNSVISYAKGQNPTSASYVSEVFKAVFEPSHESSIVNTQAALEGKIASQLDL